METSTLTATGHQLVDLGKTRLGESYVFGALAPKDNSNYHGPWDCAEFVAWLILQISGKLYGCENNSGNPATANAFTGFFSRDAKSLGNIITVTQASSTPGAFLLRSAVPNLCGHVVVCDGRGGTVEAHSHADGVIAGHVTNRRWDFGILIPWITYDTLASTPIASPETMIYRIKDPLMISSKVGQIQEALINAGFDPKGVDNTYGENTAKAVIEFQKEKGLTIDGEVGPDTAAALGITI
jgi:N-acetylmuramoyl-L-alanine amidase